MVSEAGWNLWLTSCFNSNWILIFYFNELLYILFLRLEYTLDTLDRYVPQRIGQTTAGRAVGSRCSCFCKTLSVWHISSRSFLLPSRFPQTSYSPRQINFQNSSVLPKYICFPWFWTEARQMKRIQFNQAIVVQVKRAFTKTIFYFVTKNKQYKDR